MKAQLVKMQINTEPYLMKEKFENRIYTSLVEKYGFDQFEVNYEEIAKVFDMSTLKAKFLFHNMERAGVIRVER